jgi:hypothetical protein
MTTLKIKITAVDTASKFKYITYCTIHLNCTSYLKAKCKFYGF